MGFFSALLPAVGKLLGIGAGASAAAGAGGSVMGSVLGSIGSSAVSSIFGGIDARRERSSALEDERLKFVRLREAAELGGFNPLTALSAGGLQGLSGLPSGHGSLATHLAPAVSTIGDAFTGKLAQQNMRDKLELDMAKLKLEQMRARQPAAAFGVGGLASSKAGAPSPKPAKVKDPTNQQTLASLYGPQEAIVVRNALNGRSMYLDKTLADQLGIKQGGYMTGGMAEELGGEVVGNIFSSASAASGVVTSGGAFDPLIMRDIPTSSDFATTGGSANPPYDPYNNSPLVTQPWGNWPGASAPHWRVRPHTRSKNSAGMPPPVNHRRNYGTIRSN